MNCGSLLEEGLLDDAALGRDLPSEANSHLESCDRCQGRLQSARSTATFIDKELREVGSVAVSAEFLEHTAEVASRQDSGGWTHRALWVAAAASLVCAVALGVFFDRRPEASERFATAVPPSAMESNIAATAQDENPDVSPNEELRVDSVVNKQHAAARLERDTIFGGPGDSSGRTRPNGETLASGRDLVKLASPTVLVPPGQQEAILRFYAQWREGRISTPPSGGTRLPTPIRELSIRSLNVPPIVFEPITFADLSAKGTAE